MALILIYILKKINLGLPSIYWISIFSVLAIENIYKNAHWKTIVSKSKIISKTNSVALKDILEIKQITRKKVEVRSENYSETFEINENEFQQFEKLITTIKQTL